MGDKVFSSKHEQKQSRTVLNRGTFGTVVNTLTQGTSSMVDLLITLVYYSEGRMCCQCMGTMVDDPG